MSDNHIVPVRVYVGVFVALMAMLLVTVWVSFHHWGPFNALIAMTIAVSKAVLIVLYFMHVRYGNKLLWVVVGGGFVWLALLLMFTMSDFLSRGWVGATQPW